MFFHVLVVHLYVFFEDLSIQVLCPFLIGWFVFLLLSCSCSLYITDTRALFPPQAHGFSTLSQRNKDYSYFNLKYPLSSSLPCFPTPFITALDCIVYLLFPWLFVWFPQRNTTFAVYPCFSIPCLWWWETVVIKHIYLGARVQFPAGCSLAERLWAST